MEKSVTFTGACANEIIPSINRSFFYKAKEGRHVRIMGRCRRNIEITDGMCYIVAKQHISAFCLILPTINELIIMPGIMYNHTKYRYLELTDVNIDNSRNV